MAAELVADRFISDLPIPPGAFLAEEVEARDMTQRELAERMDRPEQVISEIVRGRKAITPETALELEQVLGLSAQFWLNMETTYRLALARQKEARRLQEQVEQLGDFPLTEMRKNGWLRAARRGVDAVREMLGFLGVASLDAAFHTGAMEQVQVRFRVTPGSTTSPAALAVWLRAGELEAETRTTQPYDASAFRDALAEIRTWTTKSPGEAIPDIERRCAEAGVAFVVTPELPKVGASGSTRWVAPDTALVQINLKYKWSDHFWFTLFHEACHVLNHKVRKVFVQGLEDEEAEREADRFAADTLIPPAEWEPFVAAEKFGERDVQTFAQSLGIHPCIVVGRLQHERLIPFSQMNHLRERWSWNAG